MVNNDNKKAGICFFEYDSQKVLKLQVDLDSVQEVLLELILLSESLKNVAELKFAGYTLYLSKSYEAGSKCNQIDQKKKTAKFSISDNLLETAIHFLLKYYRDKIGEVDHIDLDFCYLGDQLVTLAICAPNANIISPEQLDNILGV